MNAATKMRELRARRKAAGLCIACGAAADTTETLCLEHADKKRRSPEPLAQRANKRYPVRRKKARRGTDESGTGDG